MSKKPRSEPSRRGKVTPKTAPGSGSHELTGPRGGSVGSSSPTTSFSPPAETPLTIPLAVRPAPRDPSVLAEEDIALYLKELPSWGEHEGQHVLIHGGQVHGFFPTREEARREGFQKFGYVAFLVKEVELHERRRILTQVVS